MSSQNPLFASPNMAPAQHEVGNSPDDTISQSPTKPPERHMPLLLGLTPFWHDRLIEAGMILAMVLYYTIGNHNLGSNALFHLSPLISLPFLLIFAILCWYRLPFAVALLPLALPYYLTPKPVFSHFDFSIAEITLWTCVLIALLQFALQRSRWHYGLSWRELRDRLSLFSIPMLVFLAATAFSITVAYNADTAQHSFRVVVFDPLVYVLLALFCLRSRQDVTRLLAALFATGFIVSLFGLAQYLLFRKYLVLEADGIRRVHAMYGSANSIGLLFDYVLPLGLAWIVLKTSNTAPWRNRLIALVLCLPMIYVLYLSDSSGGWIACTVAFAFIIVLSIRNRKVLFIGVPAAIVLLAIFFIRYQMRIIDFVIGRHVSSNGISTAEKRLYLWQSAWQMIQDHLWFGVGMDDWLCHYSYNTICQTHIYHYWIKTVPGTQKLTGLTNEPDLSHPHNIFLHVWVSSGIFGFLAFLAILVLFFWLFIRILRHLRSTDGSHALVLHCMTIGIGASMVAALVQGQVDSSFLEQDLSFCFWMLIVALLLIRVISGTFWRGRARTEHEQGSNEHGAEIRPGSG